MTVTRRRVPQQLRSEQRVAAILAAARTLLQSSEPTDVSTRDVASQAGVSPAVVYRYFANMDEVIDHLLAEHAAIAETTVAETLAACEATSIGEVFEAVVRAYLDLYDRRPDLTVTWRSPTLADRQRRIEALSDHSLAASLGRHLVECQLLDKLTPERLDLLAAHWTTVGALTGVTLRATPAARPALIEELIALIHFFASRY